MFALALIWALAGYLIFLLGVWGGWGGLGGFGGLRVAFLGLVGVSVWVARRELTAIFGEVREVWGVRAVRGIGGDWVKRGLLLVLAAQILLNFIGALAPELSFDALWYHLTLPKLYLAWGGIRFPEGNLLPSGLPRLGEMWFTLALALDASGTAAKLLHFAAGLASLLLIYYLGKRLASKGAAFLLALGWYTMLSVSWLSTAAYVDLFAVVFTLLAIERLVFAEKVFWAGVFLGLAAAVKLVYLWPALMVGAWLFVRSRKFSTGMREFLLLVSGIVLVLLPWILVSFVKTGDPLYPLLTYQPRSVVAFAEFVPQRLLGLPVALWQWTFHPDTPISPLYLWLLPFAVLYWRKMGTRVREVLILGGLVIGAVWFFPEYTNRYLLPGLAVLAVGLGAVLRAGGDFLRKMATVFIAVVVLVNLGSRVAASRKFIPYFLGEQSREQFLMANLNFSFGDFYDENGEIAKVVGGRKVLVVGIHNLFYLDFPFDHESWTSRSENYSFILAGGKEGEGVGYGLREVYRNPETGVRLYDTGVRR